MNKNCPRLEPCGTPQLFLKELNKLPFTLTDISLTDTKDLVHSITLPLIPSL